MRKFPLAFLLLLMVFSCNTIDIDVSKFNPDSIIPDGFLGRSNQILGSISTSARNVKISVWDFGTIDGDIISIYVNGNLVIDEKELSGPDDKISVDYTLDFRGYNYILLYAHNEGFISPNTCSISIFDGVSEESYVLESNLSTNGAIDVIVD